MTARGVELVDGRVSRPPALELINVNKRFGTIQAVSDVTVTVQAGEITALVGENGAGKSTLSAITAGLVQPDSGEVRIDGEPVQLREPADADRAGVRIAPQELVLCPNLTVAENVNLGHMPSSTWGVTDRRKMREDARSRLTRLGLGYINVDRSIDRLSLVEKTFVQIARAMTPGARILIVDEPTASMSGSEVDQTLAVLRAVAASGIAIIYVSHRLEEVFQISSHIVVMRDGKKVADWATRDITRDMLVQAMVGGRNLDTGHRQTAGSAEVALSVRGLSHGKIRDISFEVLRGQIVAVYGIAGSGREELAGIIAGAIKRTAGDVIVNGHTVSPHTPQDAISHGLGFVPAERRKQGLLMDMSVRQNLTLGMLSQLSKGVLLDRNREKEVTRSWIKNLSIAAKSTETRVGTLSGGSQQKVLLARWLAAGSRVLVLDEPTRGVDIATRAEIYVLLRRLADEGAAVLVVSSDIEEIMILGDRVLVLRDGRIVLNSSGASQQDIMQAALISEETHTNV